MEHLEAPDRRVKLAHLVRPYLLTNLDLLAHPDYLVKTDFLVLLVLRALLVQLDL